MNHTNFNECIITTNTIKQALNLIDQNYRFTAVTGNLVNGVITVDVNICNPSRFTSAPHASVQAIFEEGGGTCRRSHYEGLYKFLVELIPKNYYY